MRASCFWREWLQTNGPNGFERTENKGGYGIEYRNELGQ